MNFERKVKRIDVKDWEQIKLNWLKYSPALIPGQPPNIQISELNDLQVELEKVPENGELKVELPGLRQSIFQEGIFLLHKASSIARSSSLLYRDGAYTWSLSVAYQASYLATKAFLCFNGITLPDYKNKTFIVDVFPYPEKLSSKERKANIEPPILVKLILTKNFKHFNAWSILQRVIRTGKYNFITKGAINAITSLDEREFAKQRNLLHYQNDNWCYDDLFSSIIVYGFGYEGSFNEKENFHPDRRADFSIVLAFLLLRLNHLLLQDLKVKTNFFKEDFVLFEQNLMAIPEYKKFHII